MCEAHALLALAVCAAALGFAIGIPCETARLTGKIRYGLQNPMRTFSAVSFDHRVSACKEVLAADKITGRSS
jgi:hypothetical protein